MRKQRGSYGYLVLIEMQILDTFRIALTEYNSGSIRIYFGRILTNLIAIASNFQCEQYFVIEEIPNCALKFSLSRSRSCSGNGPLDCHSLKPLDM